MGMPAIVDEEEMAAATAALVAKVGGSSLLSSSTASVPMHSLGSFSGPPVLPPTMGMPAIVDEEEMAAATAALVAKVGGSSLLSSSTASVPMHSLGSLSGAPISVIEPRTLVDEDEMSECSTSTARTHRIDDDQFLKRKVGQLIAPTAELLYAPSVDDVVQLVNATDLRFVMLNASRTYTLGQALINGTSIEYVICWATNVHDRAANIFGCALANATNNGMLPDEEAFDTARKAVEQQKEMVYVNGVQRELQKYIFVDPAKLANTSKGRTTPRVDGAEHGPIAAGIPHCIRRPTTDTLPAQQAQHVGSKRPASPTPSDVDASATSSGSISTDRTHLKKPHALQQSTSDPTPYPLLVTASYRFDGVTLHGTGDEVVLLKSGGHQFIETPSFDELATHLRGCRSWWYGGADDDGLPLLATPAGAAWCVEKNDRRLPLPMGLALSSPSSKGGSAEHHDTPTVPVHAHAIVQSAPAASSKSGGLSTASAHLHDDEEEEITMRTDQSLRNDDDAPEPIVYRNLKYRPLSSSSSRTQSGVVLTVRSTKGEVRMHENEAVVIGKAPRLPSDATTDTLRQTNKPSEPSLPDHVRALKRECRELALHDPEMRSRHLLVWVHGNEFYLRVLDDANRNGVRIKRVDQPWEFLVERGAIAEGSSADVRLPRDVELLAVNTSKEFYVRLDFVLSAVPE